MLDSIINYFDKFGPELLVIQFGFLVILSTLFLWLWFANRRKYHNLKHAIPANVVKSYLDSIIQNSTSLKSSLFRGGGPEVMGIPSVMPLQGLGGGEGIAVNGAPSTALLEELNQKKAMIASLEAQLLTAKGTQKEFEAKLAATQAALTAAEEKIKELEALLAQSRDTGGGDAVLKSELSMVTKERNEFRDRLKEFEIISDDLANLKRLQQENEQLKKSLSAQGLQHPEAPAESEPALAPIIPDVSDLMQDFTASSDSTPPDSNEGLEDFLNASESERPAAQTPAPKEVPSAPDELLASIPEETPATAAPEEPKSDKSQEDLLSEFEKMLG